MALKTVLRAVDLIRVNRAVGQWLHARAFFGAGDP